MAAIISEKFRIFNAKQFLESPDEAAPTNMYFFVGRPQKWYGYLEIYNQSGTFQVGETITGGGLTATINEIHTNSLLVPQRLQQRPQQQEAPLQVALQLQLLRQRLIGMQLKMLLLLQ